VLGTRAGRFGNGSEAVREHELARRLSSEYEELDKRRPASNMVDGVPRGLERVKPTPSCRAPPPRDAPRGQRAARIRGRRALPSRSRTRLYQQEHDREALVELDRALYLSPYLAEAHLLLGRIHLRNGRVQDAIDAFKISLWSANRGRARLARRGVPSDEGSGGGRVEARRALALDPASADAKQLLARIEESSALYFREWTWYNSFTCDSPGRGLSRNSTEWEASCLPVHGRDGRIRRDFPVWRTGRRVYASIDRRWPTSAGQRTGRNHAASLSSTAGRAATAGSDPRALRRRPTPTTSVTSIGSKPRHLRART
jgi:hypothetical protein